VRGYLQFPISYRDLERMLADRGVAVDHTTLYRWIQAYAPELDRRIRAYLGMTTGSWKADETYVKVRGAGCICTAPNRWPKAKEGQFSAGVDRARRRAAGPDQASAPTRPAAPSG